MEKPLVTIRCITYNHVKYIRECLDGFVMQQTNFKFEAVVHDDASTDGTADIVREYAQKYPDIIKPILQTENQYSKRNGAITKAINSLMQGKYVAFCEGDDYWTDPLKLQKQVDFMVANPDCSLCFHRAKLLNEDGRSVNSHVMFESIEDGYYELNKVVVKWSIPTGSILTRRHVVDSVPFDRDIPMGDLMLISTASLHGKMYGMSNIMSVYRMHAQGVSNTLSPAVRLKGMLAYKKYFPMYNDITKRSLCSIYIILFISNLKNKEIIFIKNYIEACNECGFIYVTVRCFRLLIYKLKPK